MPKPTDTQSLRQSLLRVLQKTGQGERQALARLEALARPGQPVFSTLLSLLTHLDFPEAGHALFTVDAGTIG